MRQPVYLVRHGQSEWNLRGLTQGQIAHPRLTARGRRQAASAAERIARDLAGADLSRVRVITSDLTRAVLTADAIGERLRAPVASDARLREQHLGTLQGRSYQETWAAADAHDWSDPTLPVAGGESVMQVYERMAQVLDGLDSDIVTILVSHGDAIRAVLAHLDGVQPHLANWVDVPNGAVGRLTGTAVHWLRSDCCEDDLHV